MEFAYPVSPWRLISSIQLIDLSSPSGGVDVYVLSYISRSRDQGEVETLLVHSTAW